VCESSSAVAGDGRYPGFVKAIRVNAQQCDEDALPKQVDNNSTGYLWEVEYGGDD